MQDKIDNRHRARGKRRCSSFSIRGYIFVYTALFCCLLLSSTASAEDMKLQALIAEALKNNREILMSEAHLSASGYRIPQAKSLPDPMLMVGYQNEGWKRYTYGEMQGAQWMFSASQMLPFPGKLSLKGEMAAREHEGLQAAHESLRLKTVSRVRELYYDLFLAYKNIDIVRDRTAFFSRMEEAALARYSSGMGLQQEVLMAQAEKYMLLEKEEMQRQKIQATEAMLNAVIGREVTSPIDRPLEPSGAAYTLSLEALLTLAKESAPELKPKEKMVSAAEARLRMAEREYYPDFTLGASLFKRTGEFEDMWSLTTTVNIPIFYRTKQKQAVLEAEALLSETRHELEASRLMLASSIRDNYSMLKMSERLMELYKNGLIPKVYQDFEAGLAGYMTGKVEAITVIARLKALLEVETLYWGQFIERGKAVARLEAITGISASAQGDKLK